MSAAARNRKTATAPDHQAARHAMHGFGVLLMLLTATILVWDVAALMDGRGIASFSGLADIWVALSHDNFQSFQDSVAYAVGHNVWASFIQPVLTAPAALLFGLPGIALLIAYSRDISLRAPTALEIEMQRMNGSRRR